MNYPYRYVTPFIYPLFPRSAGHLVVDYNIGNVMKYRAKPGFTGEITLKFTTVADGKVLNEESVVVPVHDGVARSQHVVRRIESDSLGYVEVAPTANEPAFDRVALVQGLALFVTPTRGAITFGIDQKYARPPIIQQFAKFGSFCMLHSAAYVDRARNAGNSFLLINPYPQPLVVTLTSSEGKTIKRRIDKLNATLVPFTEILEDAKWGTVMMTANHRVTVFDVRHAYDDPTKIYNLDHTDFMNGWSTHRRATVVGAVRQFARRTGREMGIYFN